MQSTKPYQLREGWLRKLQIWQTQGRRAQQKGTPCPEVCGLLLTHATYDR